MSATIPESMRLDDLLKATGYDCPAELQEKTFDQATEGGGAELEDNKTVSITENGVVEITPSEGKDGMKKVTATVNVSGGGGDVPTEWYLWQDEHGSYQYLPFATAPDTLVDSMQYIRIGGPFLTNQAYLSTMKVTTYTKISDSSFSIGRLSFNRITQDVPIGGGASFFEEINLNTDNPIYNKTLTKGASIYLNKYVNMLVGGGDVTETITSIGQVFATVTYVDSTQVLTVALNASHPEASEGVSFKVWGE